MKELSPQQKVLLLNNLDLCHKEIHRAIAAVKEDRGKDGLNLLKGTGKKILEAIALL